MEYNFDRCPSRIGTESVKWDEYAPDVLPLWVADMDFEAAPAILAALRRRVEHGVFGYELVPQDYFDAIASWFSRRHGWEGISREQVIPTTGVIPAYSAAIKAFTRPGDRVIVQTPCYNAFFPAVRNNGCREAVNPLLCRDGRFEILLDYSAPSFRDCSLGEYLYGVLPGCGVARLSCDADTPAHVAYMEKMGFVRREDGSYVKELA